MRKILYTMLPIIIAAVAAGGTAYAAIQGGPPVVSPPGKVGPYYSQGAAVNLCVNPAADSLAYVEAHSDVLGNCAAGYTQLTVSADPTAVPSP